jgi:hypothetical protein
LLVTGHDGQARAGSREIKATARTFGTPLIIVYQNLTPELLTSEAERLGKITVDTELGWGRAVQVGHGAAAPSRRPEWTHSAAKPDPVAPRCERFMDRIPP